MAPAHLRRRQISGIPVLINRLSMPCSQMLLRVLLRRKQNSLNKLEMPLGQTATAPFLIIDLRRWLRQLSQPLVTLGKTTSRNRRPPHGVLAAATNNSLYNVQSLLLNSNQWGNSLSLHHQLACGPRATNRWEAMYKPLRSMSPTNPIWTCQCYLHITLETVAGRRCLTRRWYHPLTKFQLPRLTWLQMQRL